MPRLSFRRCARRYVPGANPRKLAAIGVVALLFAGCGGGDAAQERVVRGTGYRFSAPAAWKVTRTARVVQVSDGVRLVSVERYPLIRRYRAALWSRVLPELDRAAAGVARQQGGRVSASRTITVSSDRARSYDIAYRRAGKDLVERITFVLRDKTEYYLLCRYDSGGDTRACGRLLATFTLA